MELNLTASIPYLNALETANNFPSLFIYCQQHDADHLLEEAMTEINEYCPWVWPAIDRVILEIVR